MKTETINYYDEFTVQEMITDAIKHDRIQKLAFKILCLLCIIGGIAVVSMVDFDNGGCIVVALIGLMGLVVPFNMEIIL